jgi:Predicted Fe-S oxidoreductases
MLSVRDMSGEEANFLAGKFIEAGVMQVHFGGGEPLGRADMLPIATRLKRAGIRVTLSTNGWFLNEAVADSISSVPFSMVAFSIHGSDAVSHDSFTRCEGAWDRLVEAVGRLVDRGISTKLVMTLMRPTAAHAVRLLELAKQWRVTMVQFQTYKEYGNAQENSDMLRMDREEWRSVYALLKKSYASQSPNDPKVDLGLDSDPVLAAEIGFPSAHTECMCGIYSLTVRPNGDVVACAFTSEVIGNLHRDSLLDIWHQSPELMQIRQGGKSPCGRS